MLLAEGYIINAKYEILSADMFISDFYYYRTKDILTSREFTICEYYPDDAERSVSGNEVFSNQSEEIFEIKKQNILTDASVIMQSAIQSKMQLVEMFSANNTVYIVLETLPASNNSLTELISSVGSKKLFGQIEAEIFKLLPLIKEALDASQFLQMTTDSVYIKDYVEKSGALKKIELRIPFIYKTNYSDEEVIMDILSLYYNLLTGKTYDQKAAEDQSAINKEIDETIENKIEDSITESETLVDESIEEAKESDYKSEEALPGDYMMERALFLHIQNKDIKDFSQLIQELHTMLFERKRYNKPNIIAKKFGETKAFYVMFGAILTALFIFMLIISIIIASQFIKREPQENLHSESRVFMSSM